MVRCTISSNGVKSLPFGGIMAMLMPSSNCIQDYLCYKYMPYLVVTSYQLHM
jgi:hypothetical protein